MNPLALSVKLGALAAIAMPAMAQQSTLEEVVVTAQKRDQSLQDVPLAITALGAEDLARVNAQDMKDIQFSTPNLTVTGTNAVNQSFGIRGISDFSRNPGYDNRVGVYVDGVWVGRSTASNQSTLDVESIEVLRGPQGTLFGKNTVAGALNITSKRPSDNLEGNLTVDLGNYDLIKTSASINVPLSQNLLTKLSIANSTKDGHVVDVLTGRDYEDKDEQALRGQILWSINDSTDALVSFDRVENDFTMLISENSVDSIAPQPYKVAIDGDQEASAEVGGASLTINHAFDSGYELTSISGQRNSEWTLKNNDEDYTSNPFATSSFVEDSEHFSQELRLASPENEQYDYVLGLYFLDQEIKGQNSASVFAPAINPAFPAVTVGANVDTQVDVQSVALFAHGNYRLSEALELTAGLRYTSEDKDIDYRIKDSSGLFTNATLQDSRSADNWSPKLSLSWFANDDIMLYGSYSKAYKSGGWNADFVSQVDAIAFDDEEVDSYELGAKTTWLDGRLRLNATLFHANYSDYQVFSFVPLANGGTLLTVSNAGEVTSQGLEMDLQWLINDNWRLWSAYGYTDSSFDQFKNGGGPGIDYDGNATANAPEDNFSFGFEYAQSAFNGEVSATVDYFYRGESFSNPNNLPVNQMESREEINARIGYRADSGRWSAFIWAKNLSDELYVINSSTSFLRVPRQTYNLPRSYGLTVKFNFGS